jgi:NAD(P)H-hydrate epimerase
MHAKSSPIPTLTSAQVAEVDRLAASSFRLPIEWLMEAAGWQVARHCRGKTAVLCGKGSNGGDGLAAARHLHRWGRLHSVSALDRAALRGAAEQMAAALEAVGVEIGDQPELEGSVLVLDAIFGTGLNRPPEGTAAAWIEAVNASGRQVVAVDLPSGLEADNGRALSPTVRADVTITLGLPKAGLLAGDGPALAGEVWLVDIGIPPEAYAMVGAAMPAHLFSIHDRIQLAAVRL